MFSKNMKIGFWIVLFISSICWIFFRFNVYLTGNDTYIDKFFPILLLILLFLVFFEEFSLPFFKGRQSTNPLENTSDNQKTGNPNTQSSMINTNTNNISFNVAIPSKINEHKEDLIDEAEKSDSEKEDLHGPENLVGRFRLAFVKGRTTELEELYKELEKQTYDKPKLFFYESILLENRYRTGQTSAIEEFQNTLKEKRNFIASTWLGRIFEEKKSTEQAVKIYEEGLKYAKEDNASSGHVINIVEHLSKALIKLNAKSKAFELVLSEINNYDTPEDLFRLYKVLGDLYEACEEKLLKQLSYEKALTYKRDDENLLFHLAYDYSSMGESFKSLSLVHYSDLLDISDNNKSGLNNLGVLCDQLKLPINAVKFYMRADELGYTLASANLSYKMIEGGFAEEAHACLEKARKSDDYHENVGLAISTLKNDRDAEDEKIKKIRNHGYKQKMFLDQFFSKTLHTTDDEILLGSWLLPDQRKLQIGKRDDQSYVKWEHAGLEFVCLIKGCTIRLRDFKFQPHKDTPLLGYGLAELTSGDFFGYLEDNILKAMFLMKTYHEEYSFVRVV